MYSYKLRGSVEKIFKNIDKSFVMSFSVDESRKVVIIEDYDHHDNIYDY